MQIAGRRWLGPEVYRQLEQIQCADIARWCDSRQRHRHRANQRGRQWRKSNSYHSGCKWYAVSCRCWYGTGRLGWHQGMLIQIVAVQPTQCTHNLLFLWSRAPGARMSTGGANGGHVDRLAKVQKWHFHIERITSTQRDNARAIYAANDLVHQSGWSSRHEQASCSKYRVSPTILHFSVPARLVRIGSTDSNNWEFSGCFCFCLQRGETCNQ